MFKWLVTLGVVVILPVASWAEDKLVPPTGLHPETMVAKAIEKDGVVTASFKSPVLKSKAELVEAEVDGKKVSFTRINYSFVEWTDTELKIDGKIVKAFGVDGKVIDPRELPKRLASLTPVAVILGSPNEAPKLDTFYLQAYRADLVVFTVPVTTFYAPR